MVSLRVDDMEIDSIFANLDGPFAGLETQHKQEKYFVNDLGLVVSTSDMCMYIYH